MSGKLSRRGIFRLAAIGGASALVSAVAPAPQAEAVTVEAAWADEWPPTAVVGRLVMCDQEPGYYTTNGVPALFHGATPQGQLGVSGFPVDREIVPEPGTHVIEIDMRGGAQDRRYAVVRAQEG